MTVLNSASWAAFKTFFGFEPKSDPKALPFILDMSVKNPYEVDLATVIEQDILEFVQALYIDNSANGYPLTILNKVSNQTIQIPGGWQGYMPVLCPNPAKIKFTTNAAFTGFINVQALNFPVPAAVWASSQTANSFIMGGSTGLDHSANAPALLADLLATAAVNPTRANIEVQNQSADTIQVVLDDGAGNNQSIILLAPGVGANSQGAGWSSQTFKGRVRIYAPSSSDQMEMHED